MWFSSKPQSRTNDTGGMLWPIPDIGQLSISLSKFLWHRGQPRRSHHLIQVVPDCLHFDLCEYVSNTGRCILSGIIYYFRLNIKARSIHCHRKRSRGHTQLTIPQLALVSKSGRLRIGSSTCNKLRPRLRDRKRSDFEVKVLNLLYHLFPTCSNAFRERRLEFLLEPFDLISFSEKPCGTQGKYSSITGSA